MKIKITSSDLTELINQVSMASGGTAGDLANYLLFRPLDGGVLEVLAHSSHTFASATLAGKVEISGTPDPFLVEGNRLLQFLTATGSGTITLWGDEKGVKVQSDGARKPVNYPSQSSSRWPFLDDQMLSLKETAQVKSVDFSVALEHVKQFISADTKDPAVNLLESRDGYLVATNRVVAALAVLPDLQNANIRILRADVNAVTTWLSRNPDETVITILEGDQFLVLKRPDGSLLGVNRPLIGFLSKFLTPAIAATGSITVPKAAAIKSLKILISAANKQDSDRAVTVRASGNVLTLEMDGASGEVNDQEITLEVPVPEGFPTFSILDGHFQRILESQASGTSVVMGYLDRGSSGMTLFREQRGGAELVTAQAWYIQ